MKIKNLSMCMAAMAMMMLAIFQPVSVYAGDFTTASTLLLDGKWSDKCLLQENATDYYKFTISTAGIVNIKLMAYAWHMEFEVYDGGFDRVGGDEAYYGSETSPETVSKDCYFSQGTYYVAVKQDSGYGGGDYRLNASFSSYGITASEDDSFDSPLSLSVNKKVTGAMTRSNSVDWYRINIPIAGSHNLIFQASYSSYSINCELYDSNLSLLKSVHSQASEKLELSAGTYYIKISSDRGTKYTCQLNELIPKKGDMLTDTKTQAQYKVTKAGRKNGAVAYQRSTNGVKTSITVPATVKIDGITYKVTGIAKNAFKGNSRMSKVTIGKNVTSIGASAFSGCPELKTVTISANVSSIGKQAFYNCKKLKTVTIKTTKLTVAKTGANAFKGIYKKATFKVPKNKLSAYKKLIKKKGAGTKTIYKKLK